MSNKLNEQQEIEHQEVERQDVVAPQEDKNTDMSNMVEGT
jgi:hypothetical protein